MAVACGLAALLAGCSSTQWLFTQISLRNIPVMLTPMDRVPNRPTRVPTDDARLAVLWVGHATTLIQIDDLFILTDPVFTDTVGVVSKRLVEPGLAAEHLPPVAITLVSHRHFDHLSTGTFEMIGSRLTEVLVPEGAVADIPAGPYTTTELRWDQQRDIRGAQVHAVRVAHSGDRLPGQKETYPRAFTGYVISYRGMNVFFAGDTSFDPEIFKAVARRFGHIDLALMPICPITPTEVMLRHHLDPAQAIEAAELSAARWMVPIHFDTFVNSLDERGQCAAALDQTLASRKGNSPTRVRRLSIGERFVVIPRI